MKKIIFIITILLSLLCTTAFAATQTKAVNKYSSKPAQTVEVNDIISIYDNVNKLTAAEKQELTAQIAQLEQQYKVRVLYHVIFGVKNGVARDYARTMVDTRLKNKPAMIFVVTTKDRQYYIAANKAMRELAVSQDYGIPHIKSDILPLLKQNQYGAAGKAYIGQMDKLLAFAKENGHAHEKNDDFSSLGAILAAILATLTGMTVRSHLINKLNNVTMAFEAGKYFKQDSFKLTNSKDTYLYSNTVIVSSGGDHSDGGGDGGDGGSGGSGDGGSY